MKRIPGYFLALVIAAMPAVAQDDDGGGFLERTLEDALSGEGRDVVITGFQGALSSNATMERLTFSDADGVWLRLEGVDLVWTRSALLRGRVEVDSLTAAEIEFTRPPLPANELPSAEATGFSLPELPVSVNIGEISAARVILGAALLGTEATLGVEGSLSLEGGEGSGRIVATRLDGAEGSFLVEGSYSNATEVLTVNLGVNEAAGGIVATLAGLPGTPALDLDLAGTGPLSDFAADFRLATDGAERVAGALTIEATGTDDADTGFRLDMAGDVAPLLFPEYQAFFGPDLALAISGMTRDDGRISVDRLNLEAAQIRLAGNAEIGSDGLPQVIALTGRIASGDGSPVLLPISGDPTRIAGADLTVAFDAARGEEWSGEIVIEGVSRPGLDAERIRLDGIGRIAGGVTPQVTADLNFVASALDLGDPEAGAALGEDVTGRIAVDWTSGTPVEITTLQVAGETYGLDGRATIDPTGDELRVTADAAVAARDLSVFSGLANRPLSGSVEVDLTAETAPVAGRFDVTLRAVGTQLRAGIAEVDQLLEGRSGIEATVRRDETGSYVDRFIANTDAARVDGSARLTSTRGEATLNATLLRTDVIAAGVPGPLDVRLYAVGPPERWDIRATMTGPGSDVTADLELFLDGDVPKVEGDLTAVLDELGPYSPRIGRAVSGGVTLRATGALTTDLSGFNLEADVTTTGLRVNMPEADQILAGETSLAVAAGLDGEALSIGALRFRSDRLTADVTGSARVGEGLADILSGTGTASVTLLESAGLLPGMPVPLGMTLDADGTRDAVDLVMSVSGDALSGEAEARVALAGDVPAISGRASLSAGDVAPFSDLAERALSGGIDLTAEGDLVADLTAFDVTARVASRNLSIGQSDVDAILAGNGQADVVARRENGVIEVERFDFETPALRVAAKGSTGLEENAAEFDVRLADVGRWVPGFSGPATARGTAAQPGGADWRVDVSATAPGGTRADVTGAVAPGFDRFDLGITGTLPLQAANSFIAPRAVAGTAGFDLRLSGPPALESLSGRVRTENARFTAPTFGVVLAGLGATVDIANAGLRIEAGARVRNGGRVSVSGPLGLGGNLPADLAIRLENAILTDPGLYRTSVDGTVTVSGNLAGGASIGGALALGETEILIPSGTAPGVAPSFEVRHQNEPFAVRRTRERAGLVAATGENGGEAGPSFPLALTVEAPNRIFLRGRGLEAELGGRLSLGGTTSNVIPTGQFELIRGRLDILGQRFGFDEGLATLQGDFNPYLRLIAATRKEDTLIRIVVQGLAASPEILFESEPDLPEDEVLARLLFGRGIDTLSPLQAAQLANAVATLAGKGGEGLVGKLRQNFGLDDLDVTGDGEGGTAVRAGKYLSDNLYSDVTVDSNGTAEVSINLDLTPSVTVKGKVGSTGNTGIGVFFERDY